MLACAECGGRFRRSGSRGPTPRCCPTCAEGYQKRYYAARREQRKAESRLWSKTNVIKVRERTARRRREDPERWREYQRQWRKKHATQIQAKTQRRRALLEGCLIRETILTDEIGERDGWICGICYKPIDRGLVWSDVQSKSLDHIMPLSRGGSHIADNTRIAHLGCNAGRGNRLDIEVAVS